MSEKGCQRTYNLNNLKIGGSINSENVRINGRIIAEGGIEYLGGSDAAGNDKISFPLNFIDHNNIHSQFNRGNFNISPSVSSDAKGHPRILKPNTINVINIMNYFTGNQTSNINLTLPQADEGTLVFLVQIEPVKPRDNTFISGSGIDHRMIISCGQPQESFEVGSIIESRDTDGSLIYEKSLSSSTVLRYILQQETGTSPEFLNPSESYFTIGSKLLFTCVTPGVWKVSYLFTGKGQKTRDGSQNYGGIFEWAD